MPPLPSKYRKYNTYQNPGKKLTPAQHKEVAYIAKRAAARTTEVKRAVFTGSINPTLDSSHYLLNPLYNIAQGTTGTNRVGQEIKLSLVEFNYTFVLQGAATPGSDLWVYAYWSDEESITSSTVPTQVTTPNILATLPFVGSVTSGQSQLLQFDHFQCTPLRSSRVAVNGNYVGQPERLNGKLIINFKDKKIKYLHDAASFNEGKNLYIGWTTTLNGVVDTTTTGALFHNTMITFRE